MKKILLFILVAVMSVCAQAQQYSLSDAKPIPVGKLKNTQRNFFTGNYFSNRFGNITYDSTVGAKKNAPMFKLTPAIIERRIGLYTTDEYDETEGLTLIDDGTPIKLFSIIPRTNYKRVLQNQLKAVRFALSNSAKINSVFVMGVQNDYIYELSNTSTNGQIYDKGWNTVELDMPVSLTDDYDRYAIGFECVEIPGKKPISLIPGESEEGFIVVADLGEGDNIYNFSNYGMLSVQGIVSLDNIPEIDVILEDMLLSKSITTSGSELGYAFVVSNFGMDKVNTFEIAVKLDGKLVKTITEKDNLTIGDNPVYYVDQITIPADIARGQHTLSVELVTVNGRVPTEGKGDDLVSKNFITYVESDAVERQQFLIEEMTSHSCTFCPYGAMLMETLDEMSDKVAIACVHGNQSSKDPFNTPECQSILAYLNCRSFPSATFNRIYFNDNEGVLPGIGFNQGYEQIAQELLNIMEEHSAPAFASVDIDQSLSDEGNTLSIKVSGKGGDIAQKLLEDYALTVYVLEDSLKYRQLNNGTWVANYTHNHVLRKVATAINGDDINWTSTSSYENTYSVALDEAWERNQLSVVAFISKRQPLNDPDIHDLSVSNANSVKLFKGAEGGGSTGGEDNNRADAGLRITPFTTSTQLMGEGMSLNAKYVAGLNYGTSAPAIWDSETNKITNFTEYEEGSLHAVNSNGVAVGSTLSYGGKALVAQADGKSKTLQDNGGENSQGADAWCISDDGKTIGGFYYYFEWTDAAQTEGFFATFPCVWQDEKCLTLSYPGKKEMGFNIDGAAVRWMSADGSVLLGYLVDDKATWPAVIWRKNAAGGYDCEPICKDYFEAGFKQGKPYMLFTPQALSENGEWVTISLQEEFDDSNFNTPMPPTQIARYNLKTGKLEILNINDQKFSASAISDDGSVLLYTEIDGIFGRVGYLWKAGETTVSCLDDMLIKIKGMPDFGANVPAAFAADGKTYMGFGIDQDANIFSYVVSIDEMDKAINGILPLAVTPSPIVRPGIFTITGRQVRDMKQPGIYIVNGKKIMVK